MPVRSCAQCTTVRVPKYEQHTQVDVRETRKTEVFIYFTFYGLKQRIPVLGILVGKTTVPYIYRTFSHLILQHNNRVFTKTIMDQLVENHPDYPNALLVLPTSDKGMPRVLVPRHIQYNLVIQAHLDIHHQHYRKVHKLLRPLYYWPNMDSDIESICVIRTGSLMSYQ